MTDIKQLIERLRDECRFVPDAETLCYEAADALERLTQPVGVEPVAYITKDRTFYWPEQLSSLIAPEPGDKPLVYLETVARLQVQNAQLQAERDELVKAIEAVKLLLPDSFGGRKAQRIIEAVEGKKP